MRSRTFTLAILLLGVALANGDDKSKLNNIKGPGGDDSKTAVIMGVPLNNEGGPEEPRQTEAQDRDGHGHGHDHTHIHVNHKPGVPDNLALEDKRVEVRVPGPPRGGPQQVIAPQGYGGPPKQQPVPVPLPIPGRPAQLVIPGYQGLPPPPGGKQGPVYRGVPQGLPRGAPPTQQQYRRPPPPPQQQGGYRIPPPPQQQQRPVQNPALAPSNNYAQYAIPQGLPPQPLPKIPRPDAGPGAGPADAWPLAQPDMPKIVALDVKCERNLMKVHIQFDKPFYGIVFSKGYYSDPNCVHLPAGLGRTSANFDISSGSCGTVGDAPNGRYGPNPGGFGAFFENTIVVQYDHQVQEVWDVARKLRCTWHDQYEKAVTFRPFPVDMLDVVRADFAGDNVGCWMQIQVGKGPWASEVSGLVKIGQTMTMVLAIKDDDNKFDMLVRNCMAHDGKRAPIQLVDQRGCVTRPKLMSRFTKIKNFGASASVLSYAHFQAFKFPDSMEVHFQCTIQICRYRCPDQCTSAGYGIEPRQQQSQQQSSSAQVSSGSYERSDKVSETDVQFVDASPSPAPAGPREERRVRRALADELAEVEEAEDKPTKAEIEEVGLNRVIQVVSSGDLSFALESLGDNTTTLVVPVRSIDDGLICMSTPGFAATLIVLLAILIVSCLLSAFLCIRYRAFHEPSLVASFVNPVFKKTPF